MKLFSLIGIGVLAFGLGCQSAAESSTAVPDSANTDSSKAIAANTADDEAPRISLEDAKKAFDAGDAVFVDTRGEEFFQNEHVKGAINMSSTDFESKYKSISKDKKIIVYCS